MEYKWSVIMGKVGHHRLDPQIVQKLKNETELQVIMQKNSQEYCYMENSCQIGKNKISFISCVQNMGLNK